MRLEYLEHSDELYHYGVKGMKWGKRKKREQNSLPGPFAHTTKTDTHHPGNAKEYFPQLALRYGSKEHEKASGGGGGDKEADLYYKRKDKKAEKPTSEVSAGDRDKESSFYGKRKDKKAGKTTYRAAVEKYSNAGRSIVDALFGRSKKIAKAKKSTFKSSKRTDKR